LSIVLISNHHEHKEIKAMEMNLYGLKCPQPVLKVAAKVKEIPDGELVEILADCPSFPKEDTKTRRRE
jgi:TusA-related sulfurtransferase